MTFDMVNLFAGLGVDFAAKRLGLTGLGFDNDPHVTTMRRHFGMPTVQTDLWGFEPKHLVIDFRGLWGSPSCRKWSIAGLKEAHSEIRTILAAAPRVADGVPLRKVLGGLDPEAALVLAPLAWVAYHRPEWVALEQVTQVQPVWDAVAQELSRIGYSADTGKLSSEAYGVPQTRVRSILVANRTKGVSLPHPTHSRYYSRNPERLDDGVAPWVTMAEGLGWEPDDRVLRSNYGTGGDPAARGERSLSQPAPTITSKADRNKWVGPGNGAPGGEAPANRPKWPFERPSTTVVGSFRPDVVAAPGWRKAGDGPRQNAPGSVNASLDEIAQLQTYPSGVPWDLVNKTAAGRIIGNSVPPLLAERVIQAARGVDSWS